MIKNFKKINYLKNGNQRQKLAFYEINKHQVLETLKQYSPILVGTIPIDIDIPNSDLDIICECKNHSQFTKYIRNEFGNKKDFKIYTTKKNGVDCTIAEFKTDNFIFEIFGQNIPTDKQNAYRHMIVEDLLLSKKGNDFKNKIKELKTSGIKTEPAFAKLLGLTGNPYVELLKFEHKLSK